MAIQLSLEKAGESKQKITLSLRKALDLPDHVQLPQAQVAINMDVSYSYKNEHADGSTNDLLTRFIPWVMALDQDGQADMFTFSSGEGAAYHVGTIDAASCSSYVHRRIINKVPGYNGGTVYAPVLQLNLETFGWVEPETPGATPPKKRTWLEKKLFGEPKVPVPVHEAPPKQKSIVFHLTDGETGDEAATYRLLEEMEQKGYLVYVQFVAYSQESTQRHGESDSDFAKRSFPFLHKVADRFSNTGLVVIPAGGIPKWVIQSDEDLNKLFITSELVDWLKA